MPTVHTIDLHDYTSGSETKREALVKTVGEGLLETGFLKVQNHEIDQDLIDNTYAAFKEFFGLPTDVKMQYAGGQGRQRGFTPFGEEHAKNSKHPDLKEFWHVGQELPEGHPLREVYPNNVWPKEVAQLKELALPLYRGLERVAATILRALADYFEMPRETFASMMQDGNSIIRAIHYPPIPADADPGSVRAAAHEDINLITLLCEATESGLELLTHDGTWLAIDALEGQIVVDSGDMIKRCTNDVVPATTHRVVNTPNAAKEPRYSLPFFVHPYPNCDLSVMDRFVSDDRPRKYEPITAMEFLQERLREIGLA